MKRDKIKEWLKKRRRALSIRMPKEISEHTKELKKAWFNDKYQSDPIFREKIKTYQKEYYRWKNNEVQNLEKRGVVRNTKINKSEPTHSN